jgi:hypothetical protein
VFARSSLREEGGKAVIVGRWRVLHQSTIGLSISHAPRLPLTLKPCSMVYNSQQAFPIWTPVFKKPTMVEDSDREKKSHIVGDIDRW